MVESDEGRLSRWSRLKRSGGVDTDEEQRIEEGRQAAARRGGAAPQEQADDRSRIATDLALSLPGGVLKRTVIAPMAPLAGIEDDDDDLTRGVGHALATPDGQEGDQKPPVIHEEEIPELASRPLSEEEQVVVDALPDIESLQRESDFTPFLADAVPDFIRRRALRKLWAINPMFNFRDGLNDYDDDFNIIHKVIDAAVGNYKVGRGHLSEQELKDMTPIETRRVFGENIDDDGNPLPDAEDGGESDGKVAVDGEEVLDDKEIAAAGHEPDVRPPDNAVNVRRPAPSATEDDAGDQINDAEDDDAEDAP